VQSFGSSGAQRSLAGGRAVALVWRDPYPRGYDKKKDIDGVSNPWLIKTGPQRWYPENSQYLSPWVQYYVTTGPNDPRDKNGYRWNGYHDMRILFFKQLEQ